MSCEKFDKLIYLFLDGRLDQGKEKELKEHLSECERCTKKLALLELVEGRAKKIKTKEPPQEYWDSFSSRVRETILARKEISPVVGLKKALESIFSFSPLKIKVAAGLVSVVLVFIIGKLYVDYRGQEILPSKTVIQTEEQPQLDIMEMEKKEGFPVEEGRRKIGLISEKSERERKAVSKVTAEGEKEALLRKEKIPTHAEVAEEKPVPAYASDLEPQTLIETEAPTEQQLIPPESKPTGAGIEERTEEKLVVKMAAPEGKAEKAEEVPQKGEVEQLVTKDISLPPPTTGFRPYSAMDHYVVNEKVIPKIEEDDTLKQVGELRRVIQVWKAYIEENPTDSLTKQGYLQVATAYYLLAKLSPDTTVISEGSKLLEEYLDQIKDPMVKDNLIDRLKKIKALRQR
ncbi:MAG: zf-HC2 domain-containing protein [candidate division Zixibacteria bacterium]|nr:zf-HC2 domain-containing protein [candidate division Zixibacteria bacterium]